ncbi:protein mono-ADP-ribosyltransferase PARP10 isoform X4 [Moschus berezovskii]|uniref:protein mono-ADP-ribosyltransferase PARP10 isoform X4 n=1 Tax=Moschus berezovskii TaxID=68408 RepID=UPI0024451540|nr:protein mono-ADP-ribosyltransferase PARP10 isoform X4 [Moschus berezovskii]
MGEAEAEAGAAVELSGLPRSVPDELLTLYFENRRSSGGGPVASWQRLGCGGILTFEEPADAARVLARPEHTLQGARLSLRPAPPRAPARLLLQGLPPGIAPQLLEQYVQALLCASGHPEQPCHALASPRPDRALVQLPKPLSEAEAGVLEVHARALSLEGAEVSLAWVPQARAVRVVGGGPPADLLLLELYLENERHSGGGPLEGMRSLPGHLGTVVSFRHWRVAERVLQRDHRLQGSELNLVPHYDVLEPEELAENASGGSRPGELGPGAPGDVLQDAGGPARAQDYSGDVTLGSEEMPGQSGASLSTGPHGDSSSLAQARAVSSGPGGSSEEEGLGSLRTVGSPDPVEIAMRSSEQVASVSLGPAGSPGQEGLLETVLAMEPGAMRFIQLYHEDLLAGLGDVALFPLEGSDTTGFRVDPTESLQALPGLSSTPWPPDDPDGDQENSGLEEVRELLATLEGLDGEDWLPLELGEEAPGGQPEEEATTPRSGEGPSAPIMREPGQLQEEAELQLVLYRSLQPQDQVAEQEEAALQQALALSLLEPPPVSGEQELLWGQDPGGLAQLEVHATFERDMDELAQALEAALDVHLREELVGAPGCVLPAELCARLERCHGVSVALHSGHIILRGFGVQPTHAARYLAALLAGPPEQSSAFPLAASCSTLPQQRPKEPLGRLERIAESSSEFQAVVQAFRDTLDTARGRIHVVQVERVLHPLLQQQYELHRERLEQCCERPAEQVLYHGTAVRTVPDICAHGFNRSFCGRNGALYGQGVYFAKRASLSVLDRYSPPDAEGHKAVFVARVLTGDYGQGQRGLRAPPPRPAGHPLLRYDSAVDCLHRPSIFVIFHDTQALPTHLITCKHKSRSLPEDAPALLSTSPAT